MHKKPILVIPAEAGIQDKSTELWIPIFMGMTEKSIIHQTPVKNLDKIIVIQLNGKQNSGAHGFSKYKVTLPQKQESPQKRLCDGTNAYFEIGTV